jgi:hypothetical protein
VTAARAAVAVVILSSLLFVLVCVIGLGLASGDDKVQIDVESFISAVREQVALLKWIGGAIVVSLASAVGVLWKANGAKDSTMLAEVKAAQPQREAITTAMNAVAAGQNALVNAFQEVRKDVKFCAERRHREDAAAAGELGSRGA